MKRRLGLLVLLLAATFLPLFPAGTAQAFAGRGEYNGYFYDVNDTQGGRVFDNGIFPTANPTYVDNFIAKIKNHLINDTGQDQTGAEFIILTMLGIQPGTAGATKANAHNAATIADWESRVRYYNSQGWVDWFDFQSASVNTFWQGKNGGGSDPDDVAWYSDSVSGESITFHRPGTTGYYILRKECANPIGNIRGLEKPEWELDGNVVSGSGTPAIGGVINANGTTVYHLTPSVWNTSDFTSGAFDLEVEDRSAYINNAGGPYRTTGCGGGVGVSCWHWDYASLAGNATSVRTNGVLFTVAPPPTEPTSVCFRLRITPQNNTTGGSLVKDYCFQAYRPHFPGIIGRSGDVHAGGGICGTPQTPGQSIVTNAQNGSFSEYVVSANGAVTNFGSDNSPTSNTARLGVNGSYLDVCRPDLVSVARNFVSTGTDYAPLNGNTYDLSLPLGSPGGLPVAAASGVYLHNSGNNLTLKGTYGGNRAITIVHLSPSGAAPAPGVVISDDLQLGPTSNVGYNVPSVGIISENGVGISGAAARVDAYIFTNGSIDTCREGNTAACRNTLVVNGFLMGRAISFRRLGPATGGTATIGEDVRLTGNIYLNPPKFFDSASVINLMQNQGERPPLN